MDGKPDRATIILQVELIGTLNRLLTGARMRNDLEEEQIYTMRRGEEMLALHEMLDKLAL